MGGRQCWGLGHWMALPGWGWAPVPASPPCASEGAHLGIWAQPPQGSPGGTGLDRGAAASESAAGVGVPIQYAARRAPCSGCVDPCTHRKMVARLPGRKPNGVTFSATGTSRGEPQLIGTRRGQFQTGDETWPPAPRRVGTQPLSVLVPRPIPPNERRLCVCGRFWTWPFLGSRVYRGVTGS